MNEKIKEIECEHDLGEMETACADGLCPICLREKVKRLQGELNKWLAPHEDNDLQGMKEQANQSSLAAKQAYINALEHTIKHKEASLKRLREGIEKHKESTKEHQLWHKEKADDELYKLILN